MKIDYDPYKPDFYINPRPTYKLLRDHAPAYWNEKRKLWALSRYDDVRNALKNWKTFGSEGGFLPEIADLFKPQLQMFDPPKHTRLRRVLTNILTPDKFLAMEDSVRQRVVDLLTPFESQATMDLTQDFGKLLPSQVIADLLGIPEEDTPVLMESVDYLADHSEGDVINRTRIALSNLNEYYKERLKFRLTQPAGPDLVWQLAIAAEQQILTFDEAIGFAVLLTIAGGETTTKLIGNMAWLLVKNPDQRKLLIGNPSLIGTAVEETLRYDSSTHMQTRILNEDIELHGQSLRKGQIIGLLFNAANNDERKFDDPDTFNIQRGDSLRDHLAFAGGPHACLGAPLARLETRVTFEEILRRWPDFSIDESGIKRYFNPFTKGFSHLPLRLR